MWTRQLSQQLLINLEVIMTDLKTIYSARVKESIKPLFETPKELRGIFLKSSTDIGVIRNNGRNGAKYAPKAVMFNFKKMTQDHDLKEWQFIEAEVSCEQSELKDFAGAQKQETQKIQAALKENFEFLCHIGGGHDHIYPLIKALAPQYEKVVIINIDAHADTRTDDEFHSGTPFRQLDQELKDFRLFQIGLHPYSNSFSTLSPLKKEMGVLWRKECQEANICAFFEKIQNEVTTKTLVTLSVDADALCGHLVPAVSAVNADGLDLDTLKFIMNKYLSMNFTHAPVLGVYELNPIYDQLSGVSMNTICNFVFHTLKVWQKK